MYFIPGGFRPSIFLSKFSEEPGLGCSGSSQSQSCVLWNRHIEQNNGFVLKQTAAAEFDSWITAAGWTAVN